MYGVVATPLSNAVGDVTNSRDVVVPDPSDGAGRHDGSFNRGFDS
jgi:hypothetical protein